MTRIKYIKFGKNYTSKYYTNYEGKQFSIAIYTTIESTFSVYILDELGNVLGLEICNSLSSAKRQARSLLIHKYNVRLNEEIRS